MTSLLTIQEDEVYENPKKKVKSNINRTCNICNEPNGLIKYDDENNTISFFKSNPSLKIYFENHILQAMHLNCYKKYENIINYKPNQRFNNDDTILKCPINLEKGEQNYILLPCNHLISENSLDDLIKYNNKKNILCPTCRLDVNHDKNPFKDIKIHSCPINPNNNKDNSGFNRANSQCYAQELLSCPINDNHHNLGNNYDEYNYDNYEKLRRKFYDGRSALDKKDYEDGIVNKSYPSNKKVLLTSLTERTKDFNDLVCVILKYDSQSDSYQEENIINYTYDEDVKIENNNNNILNINHSGDKEMSFPIPDEKKEETSEDKNPSIDIKQINSLNHCILLEKTNDDYNIKVYPSNIRINKEEEYNDENIKSQFRRLTNNCEIKKSFFRECKKVTKKSNIITKSEYVLFFIQSIFQSDEYLDKLSTKLKPSCCVLIEGKNESNEDVIKGISNTWNDKDTKASIWSIVTITK